MRMISGLALALLFAPAALAQESEQDKLTACIEQIDKDASAAYQDALTWLGKGSRPAARQCAALALIALGQEAEGALRLEELANAPDGGTLEQRAVYLAQAGNAWLLAGMPAAAIVTLSNALKLKPEDAALYKDRARAYLMQEKWPDAGEDLNRALQLSAGDGEALRMRALALLRLDRLEEAWDNVEAARIALPKDVDTVVLRGDIREAMRKKGMDDPADRSAASTVSPVVVGN